MTAKNVAIVWAPNLLRSKSLESGGVAALQGVGVQVSVSQKKTSMRTGRAHLSIQKKIGLHIMFSDEKFFTISQNLICILCLIKPKQTFLITIFLWKEW